MIGGLALLCLDIERVRAAPSDDDASTAATATAPDRGYTDADWLSIMTDLDRIKDDARRNPSLDAIDDFCVPGSPCEGNWTDSIQFLIDNDVHVVGGRPDEIVSASFVEAVEDVPFTEALGVLVKVDYVITEQGTVQLVKPDGSVFQEIEPDLASPPGNAGHRVHLSPTRHANVGVADLQHDHVAGGRGMAHDRSVWTVDGTDDSSDAARRFRYRCSGMLAVARRPRDG